MSWFVYILQCADASYYVGHTGDVQARVKCHQQGAGATWTAAHRPVVLVYQEEHPTEAAAMARENQLKGWSRAKKQALVTGKLAVLRTLSRCRGHHGPPQI